MIFQSKCSYYLARFGFFVSLAKAQSTQRCFWCNKQELEVPGEPCVSAREKKLTLTKAQSRRGVWGKNKPNIEILGDLGAFAREKKQLTLAKAQSTQRCFWVRTI
jgi:hypothetical protein